MKEISDWFNPEDFDHIKAWKYLSINGTWPKGFVPEDVYVDGSKAWQVSIAFKMANAWVNHSTIVSIMG